MSSDFWEIVSDTRKRLAEQYPDDEHGFLLAQLQMIIDGDCDEQITSSHSEALRALRGEQ